MKQWLILLVIFCFQNLFAANKNIVNIYMWSGVIPDSIIQQFEKETGIKVNFSTYDSNEVMYAKLKASNNAGYDIVEPSSYYIDRMHRQNMLEKLDKNKIPNFKNLNPLYLNKNYDPKNTYSIPFTTGITGIFINKKFFNNKTITKWSDLWNTKLTDQVMLLDDLREVFSVALITLGYSVNDPDPKHIAEAYQKLKHLSDNIKLFSSSVISILIDEDANIGMCWNGDFFKAQKENQNLEFVIPKDGFVIWVDNFAIPKNAPHLENAYKFLNFVLRADVAANIAMDNKFATPNLAAQKLLPAAIRNNPAIYPQQNILSLGEFQTDVGDKAQLLYEKYWELLKIAG